MSFFSLKRSLISNSRRLLSQSRNYSKSKYPFNDEIHSLVPISGKIDLVDINGKFQKAQPLSEILKSIKTSGNRLVVVKASPRGQDIDPVVVCKVLSTKSAVSAKTHRDTQSNQLRVTGHATSSKDNKSATSTSQNGSNSETSVGGHNESKDSINSEKYTTKKNIPKTLKNTSKIKTLTINWNIGPNDLLKQKKSTIQNFLEKGHPVQIFLGKPQRRPVKLSTLDLEKREILVKTCISICEDVDAIQKKSDGILKDKNQTVLYFVPTKSSE